MGSYSAKVSALTRAAGTEGASTAPLRSHSMNNGKSERVRPGDLIDLGNGFWNARGSFKIGGLYEAGTQASLVALPNGNFLWLDSITLTGEALDGAMALTDGGKKVEAILNLHPFHTLHCEWASQAFPGATLYGSSRHKEKRPKLAWADEAVESEAVAKRYAEVLQFSLPRGVDFISQISRVHFSSLLAFHPASGTIHSDDTLSYAKLPFPIRLIRKDTPIFFHPTLGKALEERIGAAQDFRDWSRELGQRWQNAARVCAAHNGICELSERGFQAELDRALKRVESVLKSHEKRMGK